MATTVDEVSVDEVPKGEPSPEMRLTYGFNEGPGNFRLEFVPTPDGGGYFRGHMDGKQRTIRLSHRHMETLFAVWREWGGS